MSNLPTDLNEAIARLQENEAKSHRYINGSPGESISTPGGAIKSLATTSREIEELIVSRNQSGPLLVSTALGEFVGESQRQTARQNLDVNSRGEINGFAPGQGVVFASTSGNRFFIDLGLGFALKDGASFSWRQLTPTIAQGNSNRGGTFFGFLGSTVSGEASVNRLIFVTNTENVDRIRVYLTQPDGTNLAAGSGDIVDDADGLWHNYVFVVNSTHARLYKDGQEIWSTASTIELTGRYLYIAGSPVSNVSRMFSFSNPIIYNYALTAQEIADRYASGVWAQAEDQLPYGPTKTYTLDPTDISQVSVFGCTRVIVDAGGRTDVLQITKTNSTGSQAHFRLLNLPGQDPGLSFFSLTADFYDPDNIMWLSSFALLGAEGFSWVGNPSFQQLGDGWTRVTYPRSVRRATAGTGSLKRPQTYFNPATAETGAIFYIDLSTVELTLFGAALNLQPQGLGRQLLDASLSRNHALATSQPAYTQPAESCIHKVTVTNATNGATNNLLDGGLIQPANTHIESIHFIRTSGDGAFHIGTASGQSQIVASTSAPEGMAALLSLRETELPASLWVNMAAQTTYELTFTFART